MLVTSSYFLGYKLILLVIALHLLALCTLAFMSYWFSSDYNFLILIAVRQFYTDSQPSFYFQTRFHLLDISVLCYTGYNLPSSPLLILRIYHCFSEWFQGEVSFTLTITIQCILDCWSLTSSFLLPTFPFCKDIFLT